MDKVLKAVPGVFDAIRKFVLVTLSISYKSIPKQTLCKALNVEAGALKATPGAADFFSNFDDKAANVDFVPNEQNQFKPKAAEQLEDYSTVFSKVVYSSAITSSS